MPRYRRSSLRYLAAPLGLLLIGTAAPPAPPPAPAAAAWQRFADTLGVRFAMIDNNPPSCPPTFADCFTAQLTLTLPRDLPASSEQAGMRLYYGFVTRLIGFDSDVFQDRFVNGDLHELRLKPGARLTPGSRHVITLTGRGNFFSTSYVMPNYYVVTPAGAALTVRATRAVIDPETGLETLPFAAAMTDERRLAQGSAPDRTQWLSPARAFQRYASWDAASAPAVSARPTAILPTPAFETAVPGAAVDLSGGVTLALRGITRAPLAAALTQLAGAGARERRGGVSLTITIDPALRLAELPQDLSRRAERYAITVGDRAIAIVAATGDGAAAALNALAQETARGNGTIGRFRIADAPRYDFRGLHIDVARNFHGARELTVLLDQMARYRLNKLHLHLGDDEGWRLQIPALPELTEIGGFRCHDPAEDRCLLPQLGAGPDRAAPQNGFLTRDAYIALLRAAKARHIEVIPSFDMPGHSRAAVRSMEARYRRLMRSGNRTAAERYRLVEPGDTTRYRSIQNYDDNTLNPCLPATYRFVETVLDGLQAMHVAAGAPLRTYHIGADETAGAWTESPACRAAAPGGVVDGHRVGADFIERVAGILARRGVTAAGWSDGMGHADPAKLPAGVQGNVWAMLLDDAPAVAHRQANAGWRTIVSVPDITYLDHPAATDPDEPGYDWASRGTDLLKVFSLLPDNLPANASVMRDLLGRPGKAADPRPRQAGAAFTGVQAHLWSETVRSDARVDYMLFPRLLALAERAWHRAPWEPSYAPGTSYAYDDGKVDGKALLADWARMRLVLAAQMALLDRDGIRYRITPPGARIAGGRLEANTELPGMRVEWRPIGTAAWRGYDAPVTVDADVEVRARSADGRRASRAIIVRRRGGS
ncbi:family 20 glycosylhydrolase [Sphingomonas hylomeconis]|uniref:beta-N-acetylhexosaminidase n=1 Tax=Sphingomonas hylomeconis TaxID=1395958 RepID=A0ABV7SZM4_9SPHN|nr:family 20 glycosylhydrolase [Sphingomonas hylomeconis]